MADTLNEICSVPVKVKWPNDLYIGDSKLAGILCELQGSPQDEAVLVIGVGINYGYAPNNVDRKTTELISSLREECSRKQVLVKIVNRIISSFEFNSAELTAMLSHQWSGFDYLYGKEVIVQLGDQNISGVARGIDKKGQLIVMEEGGNELYFNGGEVSVRWS